MTRANSEDCLFAVKGKLPTRINAGIVQSFTAPRLEHSRKPDVVREKLVQLLGDVSRIELFARQSSHVSMFGVISAKTRQCNYTLDTRWILPD
ncbi:putative adenine methylase [Escherichia phage phiv142-3]|nr:putative adenine methylase [Escherichia phage phiv142-3]